MTRPGDVQRCTDHTSLQSVALIERVEQLQRSDFIMAMIFCNAIVHLENSCTSQFDTRLSSLNSASNQMGLNSQLFTTNAALKPTSKLQ